MSLNILDNRAPASRPTTSTSRPLALFAATAAPCRFAEGFYEEETDGLERFHWMSRRGELATDPPATESFLELRAFSEFHDLSQELRVEAAGESSTLPLPHGWTTLSIAVPPRTERIPLEASAIFPRAYYPDDRRELAIRVSGPYLHRDPERHRSISLQYQNTVANVREMLSGATELRSTPISLGIDLYGACNVKPPCVYCEWDMSKRLEGPNVDTPFTLETLEEWGQFYDGAASLVNCSVGEPFMMKNLDQLLDEFGDRGKFLEITTNGQILTERNIQRLLGRRIQLYVSLDAATPETYARLRNDRLENILDNLRRLIAAKGGRGKLPEVFLVFMPMQCNRHELDAFVRLCGELDVDRLILRPLNYVENTLVWDREGYHFDYARELLDWTELVRISARAAALSLQLGVPLSDQLDFGGRMSGLFEEEFARARAELGGGAPPSPATAGAPVVAAPVADGGTAAAEALPAPPPPAAVAEGAVELPSLGAERLPVCTEPWKSFYILRRGVMPCCYGGYAIAEMHRHRETWNAPMMQELRRELAAGRFHRYCVESTACPIVRKEEHTSGLAPVPRQGLHGLFDRLDHLGAGVPKRVLRGLRELRSRLAG